MNLENIIGGTIMSSKISEYEINQMYERLHIKHVPSKIKNTINVGKFCRKIPSSKLSNRTENERYL